MDDVKKYVMVIDEGTTGVRVLLFDGNINVVGQAYQKVDSIYPGPAQVEQDPVVVCEKTVYAMREVVRETGILPQEIAGIGITNQRGTWVLWDKETGQPYHNMVVWQDTRGQFEMEHFENNAAFCKQFPDALEKMRGLGSHLVPVVHRTIYETPGLAEKLKSPHAAYGNVDSWLVYNLTGGKRHVSGVSTPATAIYMHMYDQKTQGFNLPLLPFMGLREEMMPTLLQNVDDYGTLDPSILGVEIPIISCSADQQAALFSEGCHGPGFAKCTMGTGTFVDVNIGEEYRLIEGLNTMIAWNFDGKIDYSAEGMAVTAGACLEWAKDNLGLFRDFKEADELAESVPDNGGMYFVPAIVSMDDVPFLNIRGRASFMGVEASATKAHMVRSIMEGIAFMAVYIFDKVTEQVGAVKTIMVDGGVTRSEIICQVMADLTGATVFRPKLHEASAVGVAEMVAIGLGWMTKDDVVKLIEPGKVYYPAEETAKLQKEYRMWQKAVERSKDWLEM